MSDNTGGDTGSGFLQGVQPAQPRMQEPFQPNAAQSVSQPVVVSDPPQQVQPTGKFFTEEDIERARQQEKEKLYPRLQTMEEQLRTFQQEREAEQAEKQRLLDEAEAARRAQEEGEMEVRTLLTQKEQEWNNRFQSLEQQREQDRAVFERETQLREIEDYKRQRIEQESEYIMPELRDLVTGSTPVEVDASIESIKARTEAIVSNMLAQTPQALPRSAAPTAPPVGPMEQMPSYESLTPEDIRSMDMETYKRYRSGLLEASSRQFRGR